MISVGDGLAVGGSREGGVDGLGARRGDGREHLVGERDELVVLGDEVGLAGELDERGGAVAVVDGGDEALARSSGRHASRCPSRP